MKKYKINSLEMDRSLTFIMNETKDDLIVTGYLRIGHLKTNPNIIYITSKIPLNCKIFINQKGRDSYREINE